jgi:TatD DNase family protein
LDYHYNFSSPEVQKEVFQRQLVQAGKLGLPVVIHCRDAEQDLVELLKRNLRSHPWGVLHCFTGSSWLANRGLELGMYLSFSGVITFKNAAKLREIAGEIPADRLLVETDCPYLSPVPHRGRRNEPKYVRETTAVLASLRGVSVEELLAQMHQNFHNLFGAKVSLSIN